MAVLNFNPGSQQFECDSKAPLEALVQETQRETFGDKGFHVVKQFIDPKLADNIREYYTQQNAGAFKENRHPMWVFHSHSSVIYYAHSPHPKPDFMMSLIRQMSLFRNKVYSIQDYYQDYCKAYDLDPMNYTEVLDHQEYQTWSRMTWYKERDGQYIHLDNYGELATFLILSKKGVHWKEGGLYLYDKDGRPTLCLDDHCEPGDFLMLDQNKQIHGVEKIIGANPGRLLLYVPIIPLGCIQRWFTFEGDPWKLHFGKKNIAPTERLGAFFQNAYRNLRKTNKPHHSRRYFEHKTLRLG